MQPPLFIKWGESYGLVVWWLLSATIYRTIPRSFHIAPIIYFKSYLT